MVSRRVAHIAVASFLTAFLLIVGGYILNFVKFLGMSSAGQEGEFALRLLGILIPPLGSIMGVLVW